MIAAGATYPISNLDPRPDLAADSDAWAWLLGVVYPVDGRDPFGIFGRLLGLRCWGAGLIEEGGRLRIAGGEMDADEYQRLRADELVPRADDVTAALALSDGGRRPWRR